MPTAIHSWPRRRGSGFRPGIRSGVYDVLHALTTAAGLVWRFQPSGSVARYEARVRDDHHHVVYRSCCAITDVDGAVGEVPGPRASDGSGHEINDAEVIYWGRCPECVAATTSSGWRQPAITRKPRNREQDRHDRDIR